MDMVEIKEILVSCEKFIFVEAEFEKQHHNDCRNIRPSNRH